MKFGVVFWENTDNLGDDIQTYAAIKLLPKVDYYIDRESMDNFQPKDKKKVAVIMNGWFLHKKYHFPPSEYINPLCISMHFSKYDSYDLEYEFLEGEGLKWILNNGPIGCRDNSTLKVCSDRNINAYLSGCLTLTLPKQKQVKHDLPYICAVDLENQDITYLKNVGDKNQVVVTAVTHKVDRRHFNVNIADRFKNVEEILTLYQNALCVVTTRLHCALPCLAMGVPVLLLIDNKSVKDEGSIRRFDIFIDLLHTCTVDEFRNRSFAYDLINPPNNSNLYVRYRDSIIENVRRFVDKNISREENVDISLKNIEERQSWKIKMMDKALNNAKEKMDYLQNKNTKLYDNLAFNNFLIKRLLKKGNIKRNNMGNKRKNR